MQLPHIIMDMAELYRITLSSVVISQAISRDKDIPTKYPDQGTQFRTYSVPFWHLLVRIRIKSEIPDRYSAEKTHCVLYFLKAGAYLGHHLVHVWGINCGMSGACLGQHLGHVWDNIWGMSGTTSGTYCQQWTTIHGATGCLKKK